MVTLTARAWCRGCDWTASGEPAAVDRMAEAHTARGHPTCTDTTPVDANASTQPIERS